MKVEICCGDIESLVEAARGGAQRVELCVGLSDGGLTPPLSMIKKALDLGIPEVNVLIRPRGGDFCYSDVEVQAMAWDIKTAIDHGATGIVIGVLTPDGKVDIGRMSYFMNLIKESANARGKEVSVTFHRAFDMVADPEASLEEIIGLGCTTILSSGLSENAEKGIPMLKNLVEQAGNRIKIMAGSGVTPQNARKIKNEASVDLIHSTARKIKPGKMKFRRGQVAMGSKDRDEFSLNSTDHVLVNEIIRCVQ